MKEKPRPNFLVQWAFRLFLSPEESRAVSSELDELYERPPRPRRRSRGRVMVSPSDPSSTRFDC